MAKKKSAPKRDEVMKSKISASHLMLYVILGVYITVALAGVIFISVCVGTGNYEYIPQVFVSLCGYAGVCGSVCAGFYSAKATKENEIKLANDKYRMRLEIAKEIFGEYGKSLDDRSIDLLRKLMPDEVTADTVAKDVLDGISVMNAVPLNNTEAMG